LGTSCPSSPNASLNLLRQPVEDGSVVVSRAADSAAFPARFSAGGRSQPMPEGRASIEACVCTVGEKRQYLARLAAANDRIDLHLDIPAPPYGEIAGATIDTDARPLARSRPVAIPLPFHRAIRAGVFGVSDL